MSHRQWSRRAVIATLVGLLAILPSAAQVQAATPYTIDLYTAGHYTRQMDGRTCTAASVAMMLEMIRGGPVRIPLTESGVYSRTGSVRTWVESDAGQLAILAYEKSHDTLTASQGSDPKGWAVALTEMSRYASDQTVYHHRAFTAAMNALRNAATRMAMFRKPVGILAAGGTHAIVMTGFSATADPSKTTDYSLTAIAYSDPLGVHHAVVTPSAFDDWPLFTKYTETDAPPDYDAYWYGHWVIVAPYD